jgi:ubiquinone/menaquinone biosynthesis C-methylase UbiE
VCALALTHVADLTAPVAELARIVRRGGRVVVSDFSPAMCALGGTALFFDREGRAGYVRSYAHTHAGYFRAFRAAGLTVDDCVEPPLGEREVHVLSAGLSAVAPEAFTAGWVGIPAALVWSLTRA